MRSSPFTLRTKTLLRPVEGRPSTTAHCDGAATVLLVRSKLEKKWNILGKQKGKVGIYTLPYFPIFAKYYYYHPFIHPFSFACAYWGAASPSQLSYAESGNCGLDVCNSMNNFDIL